MSPPPPELLQLMRLLDRDSSDPPRLAPIVDRFTDRLNRTDEGILEFARRHPSTAATSADRALEAFDREARPRVSVRAAFALKAVTELASGLPLEAQLFAATHFRQQGIDASPDQIVIAEGGTRTVLDAFLRTVMPSGDGDNYLLASAGFDRSLVGPMPSGGSNVVLEELTEQVLRDEWLVDWAREDDQIVLYVPLVNHLTGQVLTRERAHGIARAVLRYNRDRQCRRAVWVLADESAVDSYQISAIADHVQPIATVTSADLGDASLGRMADHTLTVVTPGPMFGVRNPDVAFAVVSDPEIRAALKDTQRIETHIPERQAEELMAAAALCLTPRSWIERGNAQARQNLKALRQAASRINDALGFDAVKVNKRTTAGRHTAVQLGAKIFPMPSDPAIFNLTWHHPDEPGWQTRKSKQANGELFKWHYSDPDNKSHRPLTFRVNLDVTEDELTERIAELERCVTALSVDCPPKSTDVGFARGGHR